MGMLRRGCELFHYETSEALASIRRANDRRDDFWVVPAVLVLPPSGRPLRFIWRWGLRLIRCWRRFVGWLWPRLVRVWRSLRLRLGLCPCRFYRCRRWLWR